MRWALSRWKRRREAGYAAIMVAMLVPTVFLGLAALGVDTARWYVELERMQKAADAAALAGVPYLPADLAAAKSTAIAVAAKNGYATGGATTVSVTQGDRASQLKVTITSSVKNAFGQFIGTANQPVSRYAVADFTAPAPMGSPCNTFGNEPPSQDGAAQPTGTALPAVPFPNCTSTPQFWAAIEGPATDKVQGDRYMTSPCTTSGTFGCASNSNSEKHPEGYFFALHVEPAAVNTPIDVQAYDPAFIYTTISCSSLPSTGSLSNNMNAYATTDGKLRYTQWKNTSGSVVNAGAQKYCSGDYNPGFSSAPATPPTTSFVVREQTDTGDPMKGAVVSGCTRQYVGSSTVPTVNMLTTGNSAYNPQLASIFHAWTSICTFTPTRSGDYYLQVRTNVAAGGTTAANVNSSGVTKPSLIYAGNAAAAAATGDDENDLGLNSFALRAVPASSALRDDISVAGYSRMPILQNATTSSATFNLIKALPNARGQYVAFDFFDAADGSSGTGSVKVTAPADATGSIKATSNIPGCKGALNNAAYTALTNCSVPVTASTHNGQLQHVVIPLPSDYDCNPATLGGCWFSVTITFSSGSNLTDFTTWDANIGGDPVRLIE
ncbi:pilus assembly protein TadG-related protein [Nocardioides sp.]|uniref:pilus assembly protein TadG-related protein n=1 Tax=Nocardioides sp. TaxID=35761 RepID=UPI003D0B1A50